MTYEQAVQFQAKVLESVKDYPHLFGDKSGAGTLHAEIEQYATSEFCYVRVFVHGHAMHHPDKVLAFVSNPEWFMMYYDHNNTVAIILNEYEELK